MANAFEPILIACATAWQMGLILCDERKILSLYLRQGVPFEGAVLGVHIAATFRSRYIIFRDYISNNVSIFRLHLL